MNDVQLGWIRKILFSVLFFPQYFNGFHQSDVRVMYAESLHKLIMKKEFHRWKGERDPVYTGFLFQDLCIKDYNIGKYLFRIFRTGLRLIVCAGGGGRGGGGRGG